MTLARRVILLLLVVAGSSAGAATAPAQLRHVAKGMTSDAATGNEFVVIHTVDDLAKALNETAGQPSPQGSGDVLASVDFDKEIVVGVVLSNRPTGCTGVDITAITQDGIVSVVHYRARKLRKGEACQSTLYAPFDFVAVAKTTSPFRFTDDSEP